MYVLHSRKIRCIYPPRPGRLDAASAGNPQCLITPPGGASPLSDGDEDVSMSLELINPMPSVMTSSGGLSTNDLRLMYHWLTFTYNSIGVGEPMHNVLRFTLPELAFGNEFLMNGMLGIASLHRQRLLPDAGDSQKQTDLYRFKALSGFRKAVATVGPDSPNYEATLVMSVLLVVMCSQDYKESDGELTIVRWLVLYRGLNAIFKLRSYPAVASTSVFPVFKRQIKELTSVPVVPTVLMHMLATVNPLDPDYEGLPHYCKILDAIGMLYASLSEDSLGANLSIRVVSWPSYGSDQFAKFTRENRPRALVILAHYLVFIKLVKGIWWIEGIADQEIKAISNIVEPKYASYMEVPLQAADMINLEDIAKLMLR